MGTDPINGDRPQAVKWGQTPSNRTEIGVYAYLHLISAPLFELEGSVPN
jgi:hypothetical protein